MEQLTACQPALNLWMLACVALIIDNVNLEVGRRPPLHRRNITLCTPMAPRAKII